MSQVIDFTERRIKRYKKVVADPKMVDALEALRQHVENIGKGGMVQGAGGIYRPRDITDVFTTKVPPWEFGYQVKPTIDPGIYKRNIFLKLPNEKIDEVPERERNPVMAAIFKTMIDLGCEFPSFELINDDCIKISQHFSVMFWHEANPNIVTPGKKG